MKQRRADIKCVKRNGGAAVPDRRANHSAAERVQVHKGQACVARVGTSRRGGGLLAP